MNKKKTSDIFFLMIFSVFNGINIYKIHPLQLNKTKP